MNNPEVAKAVEHNLVVLLVKQVPLLTIANITLALGVALTLTAKLGTPATLTWLALVTLCAGSRWQIGKNIDGQLRGDVLCPRSILLFSTMSALCGLCWGALCALTIVKHGIAASVVPLMCTAGLVAGAASGTSSVLKAFAAYCVAAMLPIIAALLYLGGTEALTLALFSGLHLLFTFRSGKNTNVHLRKGINDNAALEEARHQATLLATHLHQLSSQDAVTGLLNRRGFDESLESEWRRAWRSNSPLCVFICDLDFFKNYNDSLGHQAGDACLRQVSTAMKNRCSRAGDLVARFGGEEFAIISPNTTVDQARQFADIICETITDLRLPHPASNAADVVTISVGAAVYSAGNYPNAEALIEAADQAMYRAKSNGRNRASVADEAPPQAPFQQLTPIA